jgi:hypothetical protein
MKKIASPTPEKAKGKKISVKDISALAKKIRKPDEKWTNAIKRASAQLK